MYKNLIRVGVLLGNLALLASLSCAQSTGDQRQQAPPVSPLGPDKTVGGPLPFPGDGSPGTGQKIVPDSRPVAGAQDLTLGSLDTAHNFLLPSFSVTTEVGNNPFKSVSSPSTLSQSFFVGRLGVNHVSAGSELLLDYAGGASFSNEPALGNALVQGLDLTETIRHGRWAFVFGDHFTYLSSSPFGFGGVGGLKNLGVGLGNGVGSSPGISSSFTPSDSIYVNGVPRAENALIGQATYLLSHRSSLTVVGSLGTLNYIKSPLLDSRVTSFQGGYTYLLSHLNSISVIYRFDDFNFAVLPQGIHNHTVRVALARRITGRLSWQLGGGPSIQEYLNPLSGSATAIAPSAFSGIVYRLRYTGFSAIYSHGLTNGSGVLPGAETDSLSGRIDHTFGKNWDANIDAGYSRNQAVRQTSASVMLAAPSTWFATARISRHFVGYGALFASYNASGQSSLASVCTLTGCTFNSTVNSVTVGYTWGLRPVVLE